MRFTYWLFFKLASGSRDMLYVWGTTKEHWLVGKLLPLKKDNAHCQNGTTLLSVQDTFTMIYIDNYWEILLPEWRRLTFSRRPPAAMRRTCVCLYWPSPEGRQLRHSHYLVTHRRRGGLNRDCTHIHTRAHTQARALDLLYSASGSSRVLMRTSSIVTCCVTLCSCSPPDGERTATFHSEAGHSSLTFILKTNDSHDIEYWKKEKSQYLHH